MWEGEGVWMETWFGEDKFFLRGLELWSPTDL